MSPVIQSEWVQKVIHTGRRAAGKKSIAKKEAKTKRNLWQIGVFTQHAYWRILCELGLNKILNLLGVLAQLGFAFACKSAARILCELRLRFCALCMHW